MQLQSIFKLFTIGVVVISVLMLPLGFLFGQQPKEKNRILVVLAIAVLLTLILVVGTLPLTHRYGTMIINRAWIISGSIIAGLLGGFAAGRKKQKQTIAGAVLYGLLSLAVIGLAAGSLTAQNRALVETAKELGWDRLPDKAKPIVVVSSCPENLQNIYTAFTMYAQDWDALPPAAGWLDNEELTSKVRQNEWLHCPSVSNGKDVRWGYAYNQKVAGLKLKGKGLSEQPDASKIPLIYDSSDLAKGAHDMETSLPKPGRHSGKNEILYLDGHVEAVEPR